MSKPIDQMILPKGSKPSSRAAADPLHARVLALDPAPELTHEVILPVQVIQQTG